MKKNLLFGFSVLLFLSGCGEKKIPDPEVKSVKEVLSMPVQGNDVQVIAEEVQALNGLQLRHIIRGNAVYVECKVEGYSFRKDQKKKVARIVVEVDKKEKKEYQAAAFVIQDLTKGKHEINVTVIDDQNQTKIQEKRLNVVIN